MNKSIEPNRVYNIIDASKLLGVNPQTLTDYCREGKLTCTKIGEWKILGQNIIDFLQKPHNPIENAIEVLLKRESEKQLPPIMPQNWSEKDSVLALLEAATQIAKKTNTQITSNTPLPPIK